MRFSIIGPTHVCYQYDEYRRTTGVLRRHRPTVASANPRRSSKRGDGTAADVLIDGDRFIGFIIVEIYLRQAHEYRYTIAQLELCLDATADDLFGGNAIDSLSPRANKLNTSSGHDVSLEAICAQIGEQFQHRLIDHLRVGTIGFRVLRRSNPILDDLQKLPGGVAGNEWPS